VWKSVSDGQIYKIIYNCNLQVKLIANF
jgi:hypothetical protein